MIFHAVSFTKITTLDLESSDHPAPLIHQPITAKHKFRHSKSAKTNSYNLNVNHSLIAES